MKKIIFVTLILFTTNSCFTQNNTENCLKSVDKTLSSSKNKSVESAKYDLNFIKKCLKLDKIDKMILTDKNLKQIILLTSIYKGEKTTYRDIIDKINEFKTSKQYKKTKKLYNYFDKKKNKIISKKEINKDAENLSNMGVSQDKIIPIISGLSEYANSKITYNDIIGKLGQIIVKQKKISQKKKQLISINYKDFTSLSDAFKKAKKEKKLILLYFTGFGVLNDNTMNSKVLSNELVANLLNKNFLIYKLYVDSRTKLQKPYISKITEKKLLTEGQKFSEMEWQLYKANTQPYFVILDENGKILNKKGFTENIDEFLDFLKNEE